MSTAMIYKWSFFLALLRACASGKVGKEEHPGVLYGKFYLECLIDKSRCYLALKIMMSR